MFVQGGRHEAGSRREDSIGFDSGERVRTGGALEAWHRKRLWAASIFGTWHLRSAAPCCSMREELGNSAITNQHLQWSGGKVIAPRPLATGRIWRESLAIIQFSQPSIFPRHSTWDTLIAVELPRI